MIDRPVPHYILAGGKSRRFGSDKARHLIDGQPMLLRVRDAFAPLADRAFAIAQQPDAYQDLGIKTIPDVLPDLGPLGGLLTALTHDAEQRHDPEWILVSSCDFAEPSQVDVASLREQATSDTKALVFRSTAFFEPFPGFYHADLLPDVGRLSDQPDRSMQHLLRSLGNRTMARMIDGATHGIRDLDEPEPP